jgi:hypothetical protein
LFANWQRKILSRNSRSYNSRVNNYKKYFVVKTNTVKIIEMATILN